MLYALCSKLNALSRSTIIFKNRLTFDKATESLKVETFLRHSVFYFMHSFTVVANVANVFFKSF